MFPSHLSAAPCTTPTPMKDDRLRLPIAGAPSTSPGKDDRLRLSIASASPPIYDSPTCAVYTASHHPTNADYSYSDSTSDEDDDIDIYDMYLYTDCSMSTYSDSEGSDDEFIDLGVYGATVTTAVLASVTEMMLTVRQDGAPESVCLACQSFNLFSITY